MVIRDAQSSVPVQLGGLTEGVNVDSGFGGIVQQEQKTRMVLEVTNKQFKEVSSNYANSRDTKFRTIITSDYVHGLLNWA